MTENKCDRIFPIRLKQYLDQYAVGQDEYKKKLSMAVYKYITYGIRDPFLVIGPSGCGKTFMVNLLKDCELLSDFSVLSYDASRLTPNGYNGDSVEDILKLFKNICTKDKNTSKRGIIFLDEIDKILIPNTDSAGENVNAIIQLQIMNALEGRTIVGLDTSKLLFVLGGAFYQLEEIEKSQKKRQLGFSTCESEKTTIVSESKLRDNLIIMGTQIEFLGRISHIIRLNGLDDNQLKAVLLHPQRGVLAKKKKEFESEGLSFEIAPEVIDWIVHEIIRENLGARSVLNVVENLLGNYEFEMIESGATHMKIHRGVVYGELPYFEKCSNKI